MIFTDATFSDFFKYNIYNVAQDNVWHTPIVSELFLYFYLYICASDIINMAFYKYNNWYDGCGIEWIYLVSDISHSFWYVLFWF